LGKVKESGVSFTATQKKDQNMENTKELDTMLDDLVTQEMEQEEMKMSPDYLFPYRLVHKSGPGVSQWLSMYKFLLIQQNCFTAVPAANFKYYFAYDGSLTVPRCTEIV